MDGLVSHQRVDLSGVGDEVSVRSCVFCDCTSSLMAAALYISASSARLALESSLFLRCFSQVSSSGLYASCLSAFMDSLCFSRCATTGSQSVGGTNSNHAACLNMRGTSTSQTSFTLSSITLSPYSKMGKDASIGFWYAQVECCQDNLSHNMIPTIEMFTITSSISKATLSMLSFAFCTGSEVICLESNSFEGDQWNVVSNRDGNYLMESYNLKLSNAVLYNNSQSNLYHGTLTLLENCNFCENQFKVEPINCVSTLKLSFLKCGIGTWEFTMNKQNIKLRHFFIVVLNE